VYWVDKGAVYKVRLSRGGLKVYSFYGRREDEQRKASRKEGEERGHLHTNAVNSS
jgi:hypothetical protein